MHYRKFYQHELETCPNFKLDCFERIEIYRGQQRSLSKAFFSLFKKKEHNGLSDDKMKVGIFKGLIEIWNEEEKKQHMQEIKTFKE